MNKNVAYITFDKCHFGDITDLNFINNGKIAVSSAFDSTIKLWDISKSQQLTMFGKPSINNCINQLEILDDNNDNVIISVDNSNSMSFWDTRIGQSGKNNINNNNGNKNGGLIMRIENVCDIKNVQGSRKQEKQEKQGYNVAATCCRVLNNNGMKNLIGVGSNDGVCCIYDIRKMISGSGSGNRNKNYTLNEIIQRDRQCIEGLFDGYTSSQRKNNSSGVGVGVDLIGYNGAGSVWKWNISGSGNNDNNDINGCNVTSINEWTGNDTFGIKTVCSTFVVDSKTNETFMLVVGKDNIIRRYLV